MVRWRARGLTAAQERALRAAEAGTLVRTPTGAFWSASEQFQLPTMEVLGCRGLLVLPAPEDQSVPVRVTYNGRRHLAEARYVSCPYGCAYRGPQDDVDEHVVALSCVRGRGVAAGRDGDR